MVAIEGSALGLVNNALEFSSGGAKQPAYKADVPSGAQPCHSNNGPSIIGGHRALIDVGARTQYQGQRVATGSRTSAGTLATRDPSRWLMLAAVGHITSHVVPRMTAMGRRLGPASEEAPVKEERKWPQEVHNRGLRFEAREPLRSMQSERERGREGGSVASGRVVAGRTGSIALPI